MLIFNDESKPIIMDSIFVPVLTEYFWVLDLSMMDYTLAPLLTLEQTICPAFLVRIKGFDFVVPTNWNILVYDKETSQLDTIEFAETAGREFTSLVYGPTKSMPEASIITVLDYYGEFVNVSPSLTKQQMLCHPVGPSEWVSISPSDGFNKYLKDQTVGDLIGG